MSEADGLIFAYLLDGNGASREVGWPEIRSWLPGADQPWAFAVVCASLLGVIGFKLLLCHRLKWI